jgi:hypothetical protein
MSNSFLDSSISDKRRCQVVVQLGVGCDPQCLVILRDRFIELALACERVPQIAVPTCVVRALRHNVSPQSNFAPVLSPNAELQIGCWRLESGALVVRPQYCARLGGATAYRVSPGVFRGQRTGCWGEASSAAAEHQNSMLEHRIPKRFKAPETRTRQGFPGNCA